MERKVLIGIMPGIIEEKSFTIGTSIEDVLIKANITIPYAYIVYVDGIQIFNLDLTRITDKTNKIFILRIFQGD